jgi:hypothetical protein
MLLMALFISSSVTSDTISQLSCSEIVIGSAPLLVTHALFYFGTLFSPIDSVLVLSHYTIHLHEAHSW